MAMTPMVPMTQVGPIGANDGAIPNNHSQIAHSVPTHTITGNAMHGSGYVSSYGWQGLPHHIVEGAVGTTGAAQQFQPYVVENGAATRLGDLSMRLNVGARIIPPQENTQNGGGIVFECRDVHWTQKH